MRAVLTIAVVLLCGVAQADYTAAGGGYYTDSAGDYYTRQARNVYYGYYYDNYGRYIPRYYYTTYDYIPASKPASSLTPKSTDAEWLDFAKSRETVAGAIALKNAEQKAFMERLEKFGITPPFPAPEGTAFYSKYGKYGAFPVQGNTVYGYSYSQVADLYNTTDINVALQQSAALVKGAQALAGDGNSQFSQLVGQINAGAARVAEIRAEGEVAVAKINATRPPARIVTKVEGTGVGPAQPAFSEQEARVSVASASCVSCHSGAKAAGKLDMSKPVTEEQQRKMAWRMALPTSDAKHMPQAPDGSAGKQLSMSEIRNVLEEAAKASAPRP